MALHAHFTLCSKIKETFKVNIEIKLDENGRDEIFKIVDVKLVLIVEARQIPFLIAPPPC